MSAIALDIRVLTVLVLALYVTTARVEADIYPVPLTSPARLERRALEAVPSALPKAFRGTLPSNDGETFDVRFPIQPVKELSEEEARRHLQAVLRAIRWERPRGELVLVGVAATRMASPDRVTAMIDETQRNSIPEPLKAGEATPALEKAAQEAVSGGNDEVRRLSREQRTVFTFEQRFDGLPIETARIALVYGATPSSVHVAGRLFNFISMSNERVLTAEQADGAARTYVERYVRTARGVGTAPTLVILPVRDAMRFAWRVEVGTPDGTYRAWLDAGNGQVLQLQPLFFAESARGRVFPVSPWQGGGIVEFQVDAATPVSSSGPVPCCQYGLKLTGILEVHNSGGDGWAQDDLVRRAVRSASLNFDVPPFNSTAVECAKVNSYNTRFQEINAFGLLFNNIEYAKSLGAQLLPSIEAHVNVANHRSGCVNTDNACARFPNRLDFGVGTVTLDCVVGQQGGATRNTALDGTIVSHEFGHLLLNNQMLVAGGTPSLALHEGFADYWSATTSGTSAVGEWAAAKIYTGQQGGGIPRALDRLDVFPEHGQAFGTGAHTDGQIIGWALWSARTRLEALYGHVGVGRLLLDTTLLDAATTAGVGIDLGDTDRDRHAHYINLLQQLSRRLESSGAVHEILAGFADAGLVLSEADAVIDIDCHRIPRGTSKPPTFTVWTGRDFHFDGDGAARPSSGYNRIFRIEVANDAAFTQNVVNSGDVATVSVSSEGVPFGSWTMGSSEWDRVKNGGAIFYRATTRSPGPRALQNRRSSLTPGNGFLAVPPPSAAILDLNLRQGCLQFQRQHLERELCPAPGN